MEDINQFKIFQIFLSKYVDITLEDLLKMERALYYYKRLNGQTLDDITSLMSRQIGSVSLQRSPITKTKSDDSRKIQLDFFGLRFE